ncbi:hypothetical protein BB558_000291 [Smittium angustum]|uniref:Enoyl-CoA hydratase n=1 Tax=Smittium angustum TaxID=133377 RepID=A0A2U1JEV8_SMIAN|nr:hypothetical protein BB558_000291 [Smittium angustum]
MAAIRLQSTYTNLFRLPVSLRPISPVIRSRFLQTTPDIKKECYINESENGIFTIVLDRPKAKNALSKKLLEEFRSAINQIKNKSDARVAILKSNVEGVFCAGADLKERLTMEPHEVSQFLTTLKQTYIELETLPMPTIAAIDGAALGGGFEMALCCDMRVCGTKSVIGLPETALGIIPGAGGTQRLSRLVGPSKTKELIFSGLRLNPEQSLKYGIVNDIVGPSSYSGIAASISNQNNTATGYDLALAWAKKISSQGPIAIRMAKKAISMGSQTDIQTGLEIEQLCYDRVIGTEDRMEGLRAFKEKRPPVYKGK